MLDTPRLLRRDDLDAIGLSPRRITAGVAAATLIRVRPGQYCPAAEWNAATAERRVVARAHALARASSVPFVFSHETAAALHGLPLYRPDRRRVHVIVPASRPGAATGAVRHRGEVDDGEVVERDGLPCTSLERTVADVARTATFDQAVVIADAALRSLCVRRVGAYDEDRATAFRERVEDIVKRSAHGITRAQRVLAFADGRAQLPGECISRIRLHELGFRHVQLQVAVAGPRRTYYVDFGLDDVPAWGEFDGRIKYVDGRMLDGRTTAETFDAEKQREDWIRGTTQRPLVRWGWPHIDTAATLGRRLAAFGVRPAS